MKRFTLTNLFSESDEHIESDKKWFEPDDHVVGKFPEKLIGKQARFTDRTPSSFDEESRDAVRIKRNNIEEMNKNKYQQGLRIGPLLSAHKRKQACHDGKRQRHIKGVGRRLGRDIDKDVESSILRMGATESRLDHISSPTHLFKLNFL